MPSNIRDAHLLGPYIGKRLELVTSIDRGEPADDEECPVGCWPIYLHFEGGLLLTFYVGDEGFVIGDV